MRNIVINGRIVANAEKKVTQSGKEYIQFRFANSEYADPKDENGKSITYWFTVTSFEPYCVSLLKHLVKGKPVNITGRYSDHIYANKNTGNCEIGRNIDAKLIEFESFNSEQNGNNQQGTNTARQAMPTTQTSMTAPTVQQATKTEVPPAPTFNNGGKPDDDDDLPF